jgi:LysR family nitrogen assimilation transcriptional regulator
VDLKDLKYFRTIAECGSISKAAAHLRVAQPAVSRKILKLEHDLGVQLLRRTSRGVTPTEAGQVLLQRSIDLERSIDETRREVARYAERPTGAFRVAIQSPLSQIMVPELVREYRDKYPNISLELTEGFSGDLIDGLLDGLIDVAIVDTPGHPHADLNCSPLWVETLMLVAQLARLPIIMPSRRHAIRRLVDVAFERQRLKFQPSIEANGALMIFEMVKAGLGYTLMPSSGTYPWAIAGELVSVPVHPEVRRTISLVTRTALIQEPTVTSFRAFVNALAPRIAALPRLGPAKLYPIGPGTMPNGHGADADKALVRPRRHI